MSLSHRAYCGRFAPSPTGPLHFGSLVCALASFLDARAHNGTWLIRIEDIDPPRDIPGADEAIIRTLTQLGMVSDIPVVWQSRRYELYEQALGKLSHQGLVYGCACSRKDIRAAAQALGLPEGVYPGTCRGGTDGREARAWRFRVPDREVTFVDRLAGPYTQNVEKAVGDFVLKRADGLWAYQLAVVVDDIFEGITDIVRGADLIDNTPRQCLLYEALGAPVPRYMHIPLVLNDRGEKLSKQQGATPLADDDLLGELERAFVHLGFERIGADSIEAFHREALRCWADRFAEEPA